jgi:hypothetical protein
MHTSPESRVARERIITAEVMKLERRRAREREREREDRRVGGGDGVCRSGGRHA